MPDSGIDAAAIRSAVALFYERMLEEPGIAPMFDGVDMAKLRGHQRAFLLQALGGPAMYSGRDIQTAHRDLGIDDEQFTRTVVILLDSLRDVGVAMDVVDRARADIQKLRGLIVTHG